MISTKFKNEVINLEIKRIGYGQYSFIINTLDGIFSLYSTDSMLFDAINNDNEILSQYAIDLTIGKVLTSNNIDY
jgi:hypothetical protein